MNWLNYHHLLYFWTVAREGSVSRAADKLHLSQPTISGQLRQLERAVGGKLYERVGRQLRLTETGKLVYRYAEEIFSTGRELQERLKGLRGDRRLTFTVGIPDFFPKLLAFRLIEPVFSMPERVHLIAWEGKLEDLLTDLAMHRIDMVLSDSQVGSQLSIRAFNHLLGRSSFTWSATRELVARLAPDFPRSLSQAPVILPTENTILRRLIEQWFESEGIVPDVVAEVEDSALMKTLAMQGLGAAPLAGAVLADVERQYQLYPVGQLDRLSLDLYAISVERKVTHPAVKTITEAARKKGLGKTPVPQ
jgi:LysR family transcriptional regulator, transcriptional activator of nhaA